MISMVRSQRTKLEVLSYLSLEEAAGRMREAHHQDEWRRSRAISLKAEGNSAAKITKLLQWKPDWVRRVVRAYHGGGPAAVRDGRAHNKKARRLSAERKVELMHAVEHKEPPSGGLRTGAEVAACMESRLGKPVRLSTAYYYLHRLNVSWKFPRPGSTREEPEAQEAFIKKSSRKREVEIWAEDEARFGLKPTTRHIWARRGVHPLVLGRRRYQWSYLFAYVRPALYTAGAAYGEHGHDGESIDAACRGG